MKTQKTARGFSKASTYTRGFFLILISLVFSVSCTQSPLFFTISQEVELREPLIKGTPTNIVLWKDGVYAASFSSLHCYKRPAADQDPEWYSVGNLPPGQIWGLAATETALYLLTSGGLFKTETPDASGLAEFTNPPLPIAGDDNDAGAYPQIQNIYGNSKRLFAGSSNGSPTSEETDYAILYDDNGSLRSLKTGVRLLSGAAFDGSDHYIAAKKSGIFVVGEPGPSSPLPPLGDPVPDSGDSLIMAVIYCGPDNATGSDIVATGRNGSIMLVTKTGVVERNEKIGNLAQSALALWRQPPIPGVTEVPEPGDSNYLADYPDNKSPALLLAGIQGSTTSTTQTHNNGYREIVLEEKVGGAAGLPDPVAVHFPGESPTPSVSERDRYTSSLGQHPINYLFQVPYKIDNAMPVFASTLTEGLWSYRDHGDGKIYWNAE
jgi:hypothetical protein